MLDYLKGHESIKFTTFNGSVDLIFPATDVRAEQVQLHLDAQADLTLGDVLNIKKTNNLSNEEGWTVGLVNRMNKGFRRDLAYRVLMCRWRLLAFFMLTHSRLNAAELESLSGTTASFLAEVVTMSDAGSEAMQQLALPNPFDLSHIAIENVLGQVENKLRRRTSVYMQSNILQLLDLDRSAAGRSASSQDCWMSIVTSACSLGSSIFDANLQKPKTVLDDAAYWKAVGRFSRLGMELYALALNTRDAHHAVADAPLVAVIVSMLSLGVVHVQKAIGNRLANASFSAREMHGLLVVTKVLYCIELTLDRSGYLEAFRESDGLATTMAIVMSFSNYNVDQLNLLFADMTVRNVLDSALYTLYLVIQKHRVMAPGLGTTVNTGVRMVQDAAFMKFGSTLLGTKYANDEMVWGQLLDILREVIESDPAYLSQFLTTDCAKALTAAFLSKKPFTEYAARTELIDLEKSLIPVARLSLTMCVTEEGKQFVDHSKMVDFIIEAIHHPLSVLPQSIAPSDRLNKVGKVLAQVLIDNDLIRGRIKETLRVVLRTLAKEASGLWSTMHADSSTVISSPRMQVLQKLCNVCTVVENMFSENRRQSSEAVRDVLTDVVPALFGAYRCALPPCEQLLAQVSVRNVTTFPFLGHGSSAKAITGVLKIAISISPHIAVPVVFKEIEDALNQIVASKLALTALNEVATPMKGGDEPVKVPFPTSSAAGDHITGILDIVPHICLSDPACQELFRTKSGLKVELWKFMHATLYLEWLNTMLSQILRANMRSNGLNALLQERDRFQRLMAFYRTSTVEVNRCASSRWIPCAWNQSKTHKNVIEALVSTEDDDISRTSSRYQLRVTGFGGALVREGIEIEGSRIVFLADIGTEMYATERRSSASGVIRYHTDLGWISEFRRDQTRTVIVEVLSISPAESSSSSLAVDDASKLLSLREACGVSLSRMHISLRQTMVHYSRNISPEGGYRTSNAPTVSLALTMNLVTAMKGFLEQPRALMDKLAEGKGIVGADALCDVDVATSCLCLGTSIRHAVFCVLEDKNGGFNVMLLRAFCNHGFMKATCDALSAIWQVLQDSIERSTTVGMDSGESPILDRNGRCALHALSLIVPVVRKLANRELFNKCLQLWTTLIDENGSFLPVDLLSQILLPLCDCVVSALEAGRWSKFPPDVQYEWLQVLGEFVTNLNAPLPSRDPARPSGPSRVLSSASAAARAMAGLGATAPRLEELQELIDQMRTPSTTAAAPAASPAPAAPVVEPPAAPAFVPSDDVANMLVSDLLFDRQDVLAVMQYTRSNDAEQLAELMIQGDESEVLVAARAAAAVTATSAAITAATTAAIAAASAATVAASAALAAADAAHAAADAINGANVAATIAVQAPVNSEGVGEMGQPIAATPPAAPNATTPVPPNPPDDRSLERMLQYSLPNLVSALGLWDSSNEGNGSVDLAGSAGITANEVFDTGAPPAVNNRFSRLLGSQAHSTPKSTENNAADNKIMDALAQNVQNCMEKICKSFSSYLLEICGQFERLQRWDRRRTDYLIHQTCEFVVILQSAGKGFRFVDLLLVLVKDTTNMMDLRNGDFYAHLLLLTLSLRNPSLKVALGQGTTAMMIGLCTALTTALHVAAESEGNWPAWVTAALVFLHEYFRSSLFIDEYVKEQLLSVLLVHFDEGEEKEESSSLQESKEDSSEGKLQCIRHAVFNALVTIVTHPPADKRLDNDTITAAVLLVTELVTEQRLAAAFIEQGVLPKLLALPRSDVTDQKSDKVLGELLSTSLQASSELRHDLAADIHSLFKKSLALESDTLPLDKFIAGLATQLQKHPQLFFAVCQDTVKFTKCRAVPLGDESATPEMRDKMVIKVSLKEAETKVVQQEDCLENDVVSFRYVLQQAAASLENEDVFFFCATDCINAVSDAMLALRRAPVAMAKLLVEGLDVNHAHAFVEIVLDVMTNQRLEESALGLLLIKESNLLSACSRFMVVLAAFKGPTRTTALKAVMRRIFHSQTKNVDEDRTCLVLHRLLLLLSLLVQSSKNHGRAAPARKSQQGVSVDAIHYLIQQENLLPTLSMLLFHIPCQTSAGVKAFQAAIEMVELLTRPKVLEHLDLHIAEQQANSNRAVSKSMDSHTADEMVDCSMPLPVVDGNGVAPEVIDSALTHDVEGDADGGSDSDESEQEEEDDDNDDGEEEQAEEDGNDDDDGDAPDPDEDDEDDDANEDDEDEDDEDEDEDEPPSDDHANTMREELQALARSVVELGGGQDDEEDDSFVNVESSGTVMLDRAGNIFAGLMSPGRMEQELDFNLPNGAAFITPPDGNRANNDFHMVLHELSGMEGDDNAMERVAELARMLTGPMQIPTTEGLTESNATTEILPQGLQAALEVDSHRRSQHPMLENVSMHPLLDTRSSAVAQGSRLRSNRTPAALQVLTSDGTGYRTILQLPDPSLPLGGMMDAFGLSFGSQSPEDIHRLPLQALWPSAGGSRAARSLSVAQPAAPTTSDALLSSMQNLVADHLMRELDADEGSEDASHSTFTSRGAAPADGYSLSLHSSQAVQDPNPRINQEEESVRGGPIPPLIDFSHSDQEDEGNEEMSVLTLPQEDANAAFHFGHRGETAAQDDNDDASLSAAHEDISVASPDPSTIMAVSENGTNASPSLGLTEAVEEGDDVSQTHDEQDEDDNVDREEVPEAEDEHDEEVHLLEEMAAEQPAAIPVLSCPPGYDADVFYSLPAEMQQEIMDQHGDNEQQMRELAEASGFDYETIISLPDNIRQEVLEQARRDRGAAMAPAAQAPTALSAAEENMNFLASLTLELRAEVLLTADATFLNTMPPEILAEAQVLRERAANNFQRRELIQQHHQHNAAAAAVLGTGAEDGPEFDSEGDEEDMDGEEEVYVPRSRARRNAAIAGGERDGTTRRKRYRDGCMSFVSIATAPQTAIPSSLLVAAAKGLLVPNKQRGDFTSSLLRTSQNLCFSMELKDGFLRLLTGIYMNDKRLARNAMRELSSGQIDLENFADVKKDVMVSVPQIALRKRSGDALEVSAVASHRLIFTLNSLCSTNCAFIFLLLAARNVDFVWNEEASTAAVVRSGSHSPVKGSQAALLEQSSNSLLEIFFGGLSKLLSSTRSSELEALISLLDQATAPLDDLGATVSPAPAAAVEAAGEGKASDEPAVVPPAGQNPSVPLTDGTLKVAIPSVVLGREALSQICDVLLSDLCSTKVFQLITNIISRLSKVSSNSLAFTELLRDVIVDLAEQTKSRLSAFHDQIRAANAQDCESKASGEDGSSLRQLLPISSGGSQQYDRLLRLIHTLQQMAEKSGQSFEEIAPFDALSEVTAALEQVLLQLKVHLVDEDSADQHGLKANPQQTFLVSTLRRILPVIESFFITFGCDILTDKTRQPASVGVPAVEAADVAGPVSQALANTPGCRYRNTAEYHRANLSLHTTEAGHEGEEIGRVHSLRRQPSLSAATKLNHNISMTSTASNLGANMSYKHARLLGFIQSNRSLLNTLIRSKPALLEGSMAMLTRVVHFKNYLSFENKRKYFFNKLRKLHRGNRRSVHLQIRRSQVFEDTFHQLRPRTAEEMRGRLQVNFYNEEGIDAGGLTREWFMILSREIFNPNYALFMAAADGSTFQPNPLSIINSNHLDYFKIVGRVIGKAICDGHLMDAHFTRSFYKHVLGLPIEVSDIEATEPDYYKNLRMMLEHPLEQLGLTGTTFTAEIQQFGRTEDVDLVPNGSQIAVTDENKFDYVRLVAHHRMTSAISAQIDAFLSGFYDLVPPELVCIFSPAELELLICGLPDVNIDELQANTDYHQYRTSDDMIRWFWNALRSFNREQRAAFLQFVTGTSKVCVNADSLVALLLICFFR